MDLVGNHDGVVLSGQLRELTEFLFRINPAEGIVGVTQQDDASASSKTFFNAGEVEETPAGNVS